jgi:succinate dehydrogenase / fumarate reductase membrane anchor subunit
MSDFQTPLKRVRGLGAAREGVGHWWGQRLTAIALAPLSIWFLWLVTKLAGSDYSTVRETLGSPLQAIPMILFVYALFHHGQLGLQVVIEDYVHQRPVEIGLLILVKFLALAAGLTATISVLILIFGGTNS